MKNIDFSKLTRPNIHSLTPYEAKELPCKVRLAANESPYCLDITPDKKVLRKLNRYPDPDGKELKKTIAKNFKITPDNILLGNGSDEIIYYLITTFGGHVLYPVPTFSMYGIISQAIGEKHIGISLDNNFDLDLNKMLSAIKKYRPKLVFLSSPNNPTGNCFSADRILKIIETSKGIVVVDEAYQPFSSEKGFLPMLKDYKNLAILRTLSKIGFASLRVGFLIADKGLINEVNKVRLPFNLNALSQSMALEAFRDKKAIHTQIKTLVSERERLSKELSGMKEVRPYPSEANFILFRANNADLVYQKLIRQGVLVRNLSNSIKNSLRVTIGTPEENNFFIKALRKSVGGKE
ncbi:MAG: histidinol-phosphate transaminase [Thermodesulfovibrionales bacterium]|nr:histidinol-phosphate transaminase [Thermodesulfovibrionales bacterium]